MSNGRVYVCSMTKVVDTVRSSGARSLVTILTAGASLVRPCEIPRERHLRIAVSDIVAPTDGHILPGRSMSTACSPFWMNGTSATRWLFTVTPA